MRHSPSLNPRFGGLPQRKLSRQGEDSPEKDERSGHRSGLLSRSRSCASTDETAEAPRSEREDPERKEPSITTHEPLVTGIDFVAVPTDDFNASFHFYSEVLGLPCIARYGRMPGAEFQAGNLTLALMQNDAFGQAFSPNSMPIALQVSDVAAGRKRLEAAGVRFTTETFDSGVCHQAIFVDPAGNPLDLHNRYAPPNPGGDQSAGM